MSAVAGILLLVIMGSRFIRYFSDAAEGDFPVTILGSLMVFHLPGFMELILPLSFFFRHFVGLWAALYEQRNHRDGGLRYEPHSAFTGNPAARNSGRGIGRAV
ncbi:hypothetical protein [Halomonas sp. KX33721]|uniref:hypothetical protein n=1 Tax=Halomonas sp. KX33721 TaxID=1819251 RepID=UPI000AECDA53